MKSHWLVLMGFAFGTAACGEAVQVGAVDGAAVDGKAVDGGSDAAKEMEAGTKETGPITCSWPKTLDPVDSGGGIMSGNYSAYRWELDCKLPSGAGGSCTSDSPTQPDGCGGQLSGATCTSLCSPDDYVVVLQAVEDSPPFPSCTSQRPNPDQSFFCCPCGTGTDGG
jgi:hypothetical protein